MGGMETPAKAVHQMVIMSLGKQIATRRTLHNPHAAPTAEEAVGLLLTVTVVVPEMRRGEGRVRRVVTEERNAPGKSPPAGGRKGGMLLLPHAPATAPAVSVVAVAAAAAVAASVIAQEGGRLQRGRNWGKTNLTFSDLTTAWRPRRTKTARGGLTGGQEIRFSPPPRQGRLLRRRRGRPPPLAHDRPCPRHGRAQDVVEKAAGEVAGRGVGGLRRRALARAAVFVVALPPLTIVIREQKGGRAAEERAEGRSSTTRRVEGAAIIGAAQGAEAVEAGPELARPMLDQARGRHRLH